MKWLREHSLSIVLAGMWLGISVFAWLIASEWKWEDYFQGLAHDAYGAFVIVVATKYFVERGKRPSAESK